MEATTPREDDSAGAHPAPVAVHEWSLKIRQAALVAAGRGWPVFPCVPGGKAPATTHGFKDASLDPDQIVRWWSSRPTCNLGIATGPASLVVVDVDPNGLRWLQEIESARGRFVARRVRTPRGGFHLYFAASEDTARIQCSTNRVADGVDVRGAGGYVVAEPSRREDGALYELVDSQDPGPLPTWLEELARLPGARRARTRTQRDQDARNASETTDRFHEGERNDRLTRIAGELRRQGHDEAAIRTALLQRNQACCDPPLDEVEVAGIAASVAKYPAGPHHEYVQTSHGIVRRKQTRDGVVEVALTNFSARIVGDVVRDDGAETSRCFEIEVRQGERVGTIAVPTARFAALEDWPIQALGPRAVVYAGQGSKDHARAAIQLLSPEPAQRRVFTHTGWRRVGDHWAYLHAGGAIGAQGVRVEVDLSGSLAHFHLPPPPEPAALRVAIRASLRILDVASDELTLPLLAAVYRAVLGGSDFSVHLAGPTGVFKSEIASLAQQHYGSRMDSRNLPLSWSSTANAIEGLTFGAKDVLLVVDDFCPGGSPVDVARTHQAADRVFRAQGNLSARQRMRADGTIRPAKPPRGLLLSTGEDVPRGQSLRARVLVLEVAPGAVDVRGLSACQRDAADGLYAEALSGFVATLADRYDDVRSGLSRDVERMRSELAWGGHARTPTNVASLALGWRAFLEFALASGAIDELEHEALSSRGREALSAAGAAQGKHLDCSEPSRRFRELLAAALASGDAHVAQPGGGAPKDAKAWGWRLGETGDSDIWRSSGRRIGWLEGDDLFLEPDASLAVAQDVGRRTGEALNIGGRVLWKRLHEKGLLVSVDAGSETLKARRTLDGHRRHVLHLRARDLHGPAESGQPGQLGVGGHQAGLAPEIGTRSPAMDPAGESVVMPRAPQQPPGLPGSANAERGFTGHEDSGPTAPCTERAAPLERQPGEEG
ncbi:MAG: bifunctional DNA primase/polymerase [Deltaproteobacteria bacterium]|nr:bifunctional DNA primase/polymerase [Deltaproteobacteria bacterium]